MVGKGLNLGKLRKNYEELDTEGKNTLLRIGEKVFKVKNFVNDAMVSLANKQEKTAFHHEKPV